MKGRNVPSSWAGFRALRQRPAPICPPRHGNWKHGMRSRWGIAEGRSVRALILAVDVLDGRRRVPDERLVSVAVSLAPFLAPRPVGWRGYRGAPRVRERDGSPMRVDFAPD